jgi:hypothetical protein
MKKIMMLLIAMVLLLGVSGQALAYFEDGDLIRVVYSSTGTMESATDLGSITSLTSPSTAHVVYNTNNFSLGQLGSGATLDHSYVAYFTATLNPNHAWTSGSSASGQTGIAGAFQGYVGSMHYTTGLYQVNGGHPATAMETFSTGDPLSYVKQLASVPGALGGFLNQNNGAEANLAALATVGYVDQYLYYYGSIPTRGNTTGMNVATIRTFADGHTELNPVPIPAAVYLLGSGLLGLVGIRRKMSA